MATQRKSLCSHLPIDTNTSYYYSIPSTPLVASESASSKSHVTTPQDTVNLTSSYFPPADFDHPQMPGSTQAYLGEEPSHGVPISFQYDLDFNSQAEDIFPWTNNPCQSYSGRYDPSSSCHGHFLPPSNSPASFSMEHGLEPYQQWLDPNTQYVIPQTIPSYESNASSSTFPGNSDNDIYAAEIAGSSHFMMTSANDGTETTLSSPNYDSDANNLHNYSYMCQ